MYLELFIHKCCPSIYLQQCSQPVGRVPLVVRKGFLGGTRVTFSIFTKKPGSTAFR